MDAREQMSEIHGEDFSDNFDNEFDMNDAEEVYVPTFRQKLTTTLMRVRDNKAVWYVAGFVDALIVIGVASWLL